MTVQATGVYEVLAAYGAGPDILEEYHCVPVRARVVKDVLKIRTGAGARALKRVNVTEQRLHYVFQCAEYLSRSELAFVPRFIRNRYGDPYVSHESGLYYMTAWWPGREADFRKQQELLAGARLLAEWHQAAAGFRPTDGWHPESSTLSGRVRATAADLRRMIVLARENNQVTAFDRMFSACADELAERLEESLSRLQEANVDQLELAAREQGLLCHGSYTRQNVWFNGERYAALSYDRIHRGLPATELALFMHRYLPGFDWDTQVAAEVVTAYRQTWADTAAPDRVMEALLCVPLRTLQVVSWYYHNAKDWDEEDYVDALEASLELDERRARTVAELYEAGTVIPVLEGFPKSPDQMVAGANTSAPWDQTVAPQLAGTHQSSVEERRLAYSVADEAVPTGKGGSTDLSVETTLQPPAEQAVDKAAVPVAEEAVQASKPKRKQGGRAADVGKRRNSRSSSQVVANKRGKESSPHSRFSGPKLLGDKQQIED